MKKVSVIVPVHNSEKYLDRCIQSLINQEYSNIEILLIENCSSDSSLTICRQYEQAFNFIKVISTEQKGVSRARNIGLENATGDYICFVDSDDYVCNSYISKFVKSLQESDCKIGFCGDEKVYSDHVYIETYALKTGVVNREEALALCFKDGGVSGYVWNKIFDASLLKEIRFDISIEFAEDLLFSIQALLKVNKVCCVSDVLYEYTQTSSSSTTHSSFEDFNERFFKINSTTLSFLKAEKLIYQMLKAASSNTYKYAGTMYMYLLVNLCSNAYLTPEKYNYFYPLKKELHEALLNSIKEKNFSIKLIKYYGCYILMTIRFPKSLYRKMWQK